MQQIRFTTRLPTAKAPTKGTEQAAGHDLYAAKIDVDWNNHHLVVDTGLNVSFDPNHVMLVFGRSGLASKHGIRPANGVGVIDADYRGPLKVVLRSDKLKFSELVDMIRVGDRIAQALLLPIPAASWEAVAELDDTARGEGGFGSTGTN
ncbi:dUTP diphosphatase [Dyella sp. ASV21]|uniref:dUTP diphosphatase n=1 Tax=Dyella sp. ASV21 TaxID=2795114 RepID=UPI0018ED385A|nr:dUTP diphosphatase [Dyella sp. ASV21]